MGKLRVDLFPCRRIVGALSILRSLLPRACGQKQTREEEQKTKEPHDE